MGREELIEEFKREEATTTFVARGVRVESLDSGGCRLDNDFLGTINIIICLSCRNRRYQKAP